MPTVIWCDTLGKEMFRRGGNYGSGAGADQIVRDLSRALDRIPGERRSRAEYETHVQPLDEGERAFTERRWNDAIKMLTSAKNGPLPALTKAADEKLSEIRKIGERLLLEAQAYLEIPEVESARERLKLLSEQFIALECGRKAAELLKSLDEAQSKKR
ncbi:MAG: hypothetical protein HY716_15715 [Planctomycetes bacterium]|nr:hypothetical protein [Planctomycetota bacterium]